MTDSTEEISENEWKERYHQWRNSWEKFMKRGTFFCWHEYVIYKGEMPSPSISANVHLKYGIVKRENSVFYWGCDGLKQCAKCGKIAFNVYLIQTD